MKETTTPTQTLDTIKSDDGMFGYEGLARQQLTEERINQMREEVKKYEASAESVIFSRMKQRGVISDRLGKTFSDNLTEEQWKHNRYLEFLDTIFEDGEENFYFYMFTPKTEEDIKDMMMYLHLTGCRIFERKAETEEERKYEAERMKAVPYSIYARELKAGSNYIAGENDGWWAFVEIDKVAERIKNMSDYFIGLCKSFKNKK